MKKKEKKISITEYFSAADENKTGKHGPRSNKYEKKRQKKLNYLSTRVEREMSD